MRNYAEYFYQEVLKEAKESEEQIVILCDIKGGTVPLLSDNDPAPDK